MAWNVEVTETFAAWYARLTDKRRPAAIQVAVETLQREGPTLGRPLVDHVNRSKLHNLKELRPLTTDIRILFVFDDRRTAVLLLGGDKAGEWTKWYAKAIRDAERLYDDHVRALSSLEKESA